MSIQSRNLSPHSQLRAFGRKSFVGRKQKKDIHMFPLLERKEEKKIT